MAGIGEIVALAKGLGGSGGGSSGGVLVVNWNTDTGALDKTWQEIHDAAFTGVVFVLFQDGDLIKPVYLYEVNVSGSEYQVGFASGDLCFVASSASGYPVYSE